MATSRDESEVKRVDVAVRTVRQELGQGDFLDVQTVNCPITGSSESLNHCDGCERRASTRRSGLQVTGISCHIPTSLTAQQTGLAATQRGRGQAFRRALAETRVADVLSGKRITCVDSILDIEEVGAVFSEHGVKAAPVLDETGALVGILTQSDLIRGARPHPRRVASVRFPPEIHGLLAEDVMSPNVETLREEASLLEAARRFSSTGFHRLPVVTGADEVVGMLSLIDVIRWISDASEAAE